MGRSQRRKFVRAFLALLTLPIGLHAHACVTSR
jgi:hypothetical protein